MFLLTYWRQHRRRVCARGRYIIQTNSSSQSFRPRRLVTQWRDWRFYLRAIVTYMDTNRD